MWDAFRARVTSGAGRFEETDPQVDGLRAVWGDGGPAVAWDGERWRIERGVLGLYPRDTPAHTLRSFVAAYRSERWSVLLSMAPESVRASLSSEDIREKGDAGALQDLLGPRVLALEEALAAGEGTPTTEGARAQLEYGPYRAVLEPASDGWVVLDL